MLRTHRRLTFHTEPHIIENTLAPSPLTNESIGLAKRLLYGEHETDERAKMKRCVLLAVTIIALSPAISQSADVRRWLRRVTLGAACVAGGLDVYSTWRASRAGAVEFNPLFRGAGGRPSMGRVIGFKAGACIGLAVTEEKLWPRYSGWLWVNGATAASHSWVAKRNWSVADQLAADNPK
jgi:hypothetical protein